MKILALLASMVLLASAFKIPRQDEDEDSLTIFECGESTTSKVIDIYPGKDDILIQTYKFGQGSYNNNQNCTYVMKTGDKPVIVLITRLAYDVEYSGTSCSWDYTCRGGDRECGQLENGTTKSFIVPAEETFTLLFISDFIVSKSGVQEKYSFLELSDPTAVPEYYKDHCYLEEYNSDSMTTYVQPTQTYPTYTWEPFTNYPTQAPPCDNGENPTTYYNGENPTTYDNGENPTIYEYGENPPIYDNEENPTTYDNGENPPIYDNEENPTTYDNGENPTTYDNGENPTTYGNYAGK